MLLVLRWWFDRKVTPQKGTHGACLGPDEKKDVEAATKISKHLDIPYFPIDCSKEYDEIVLKYFKDEYLSGRTPNPCIRCNSLIKFGVLPLIAKEKGINPLDALAKQANISEENLKNMTNQLENMFKDMSENMDIKKIMCVT